MNQAENLEQILEIHQLRSNLLKYTKKAFKFLPFETPSRILDVGCGNGAQTFELSKLCDAKIIGIDNDESALKEFRKLIMEKELAGRVHVMKRSVTETGFVDKSFDLIWGEGIFHLLDPDAAFPECRRLLKQGGYIVMHETLSWFKGIRDRLDGYGLKLMREFQLPRHCWWHEYGEPLEKRINDFKLKMKNTESVSGLDRYENEVAVLKKSPGKYDCAFYFISAKDERLGT